MINPHSIRFRLVAWYSALLLIIALLFGVYTYESLNKYLIYSLSHYQSDRGIKIGETLISNIPQTGEQYVASEIRKRYAPELNDRFIRVVRPDKTVLYESGNPTDKSFEPGKIPRLSYSISKQTTRIFRSSKGIKVLVVTTPVDVNGKHYLVEVGSSELFAQDILANFLKKFIVSLSIFAFIVIISGYALVVYALKPVRKISVAASEITHHKLNNRLPEITTGDEIEQLSTTLNRMIDRLESAFQTSSRFSADASHELRTPLTIMRGELEALLSIKTLPKDITGLLESLLDEANHLSKIVEGLLSLSHLDIGKARSEYAKCDLSVLVKTTTEQMLPLAQEKEILILCETAPSIEVYGDWIRLKQMVINLLDNAVKYTEPKGEIKVNLSTESKQAILTVADNGIGISKESLPHIFERFYRANEIRISHIEGNGLGLSIVSAICQAHGGSISVNSIPSKGSCFKVQIPILQK